AARERSARVPEGLGNLTGSIGPGWPTLGAETAESLRVMCKVAPRAAGYLGQHLSCEWVIDASIQRPRDSTYGMRYRVLAVHGGPLAKDRRSWDDAALWAYCEAKAERQEGMSGIAVRENGKVSAYRLGLGLMMLSYSGEAWKAAICCGDGRRRRRTPRMYRVPRLCARRKDMGAESLSEHTNCRDTLMCAKAGRRLGVTFGAAQ
ncbi:UNVERIFIED_CONTAM: hypothetical protein Sindi_2014000, partial [Sesamum indicum]